MALVNKWDPRVPGRQKKKKKKKTNINASGANYQGKQAHGDCNARHANWNIWRGGQQERKPTGHGPSFAVHGSRWAQTIFPAGRAAATQGSYDWGLMMFILELSVVVFLSPTLSNSPKMSLTGSLYPSRFPIQGEHCNIISLYKWIPR